MGAFVVRRLIWTLVTLFAITVMVFLVFFAIPGIDPVVALAGRNPAPATVRAIRHAFGLDLPLPLQYLMMMKRLFVARDLVSYTTGLPILPQVTAAAPVTLSLVGGAATIWVSVSITVGVTAAAFRGQIVDRLLMITGLIAISTPVFWLGSMANLITQSRFHNSIFFSWVPPSGYVPLTSDPFLWFKQLLIPWLVLSAGFIGIYSRVLRASIVEIQEEDFVRTARAKGLSELRVLIWHVLRMSLISFLSLLGLDIGGLMGGVVLVEVVFGLPGVGLLAFRAAGGLDLPVIMVTVVYGAFFIVIANMVVDIGYAWLDPRVRPS